MITDLSQLITFRDSAPPLNICNVSTTENAIEKNATCAVSTMNHIRAVADVFCALSFTSCNATTVFPNLTSSVGEPLGN